MPDEPLAAADVQGHAVHFIATVSPPDLRGLTREEIEEMRDRDQRLLARMNERMRQEEDEAAVDALAPVVPAAPSPHFGAFIRSLWSHAFREPEPRGAVAPYQRGLMTAAEFIADNDGASPAYPEEHPRRAALDRGERQFMLRNVERLEGELRYLVVNQPTVREAWHHALEKGLSETSAAELALICLARENEDLRRGLKQAPDEMSNEPVRAPAQESSHDEEEVFHLRRIIGALVDRSRGILKVDHRDIMSQPRAIELVFVGNPATDELLIRKTSDDARLLWPSEDWLLTGELLEMVRRWFDGDRWLVIARGLGAGRAGDFPCMWPMSARFSENIPPDCPTQVEARWMREKWCPGFYDRRGAWCELPGWEATIIDDE